MHAKTYLLGSHLQGSREVFGSETGNHDIGSKCPALPLCHAGSLDCNHLLKSVPSELKDGFCEVPHCLWLPCVLLSNATSGIQQIFVE